MYLNVSQLMREHSGSRRSFDLDERFSLPGESVATRVRGTVEVLRTDKSVWVSAALDCQAVCVCSRCLAQYRQQIHMDIEEEFLPSPGGAGWQGQSPEESDESFHIESNNILDLGEAVSQYVSLSVPMKPLCREDCAGICSICGANLNETACLCEEASLDLKWAPLLDLVMADEASDQRGD